MGTVVLGRRRNAHSWNDKVTNELFLWKKFVASDSPAANGEPLREQDDSVFWVSKVFDVFMDTLGRVERPCILDLGPVMNGNISFYGELGWKVYAFDILQEYREAIEEARARKPEDGEEEESRPDPIEAILDELDYPPGLLNGVLCWDILDRLPPNWGRELIRRISAAMEDGGVILSFFGVKDETGLDRHRGFRIQGQDRLEPIADRGIRLERYSYENGEIMSMFSDFKVLNFYLMKNKFREILVQKQPQASLKAAR
ncbi:MAG: hypothetical protein ACE5IM_09890 [Nitrospinota bacterium]